VQLPQSLPLPTQSSTVAAAEAATTTAGSRECSSAVDVAAAGRLGPSVGFWGLAAQCRLVGCRVRVRALRKTERHSCTFSCNSSIYSSSPPISELFPRRRPSSACVSAKPQPKPKQNNYRIAFKIQPTTNFKRHI